MSELCQQSTFQHMYTASRATVRPLVFREKLKSCADLLPSSIGFLLHLANIVCHFVISYWINTTVSALGFNGSPRRQGLLLHHDTSSPCSPRDLRKPRHTLARNHDIRTTAFSLVASVKVMLRSVATIAPCSQSLAVCVVPMPSSILWTSVCCLWRAASFRNTDRPLEVWWW